MGSFRSRVVARKKLRSMVHGTRIVRAELTGEPLEHDAGATVGGTATWGKAN
jgi:hypothetical protein